MNREDLIALARKILNKEASEAEVRLYNTWYNAMQSDAAGADREIADEDLKKAAIYAQIEKRIDAVQTKHINEDRMHRPGLWPRITGLPAVWKIAAAVTAITLGVWLYQPVLSWFQDPDAGQDPGSAQYTNDIAPGKNTATLTLASGEVINLDTNRTSVVVADSVASSTMLTARTPRGGTYSFILPDGTKVWLNADSRITFPSQFSGKERKVLLEGEGYFVVVHNARQPFRVESRGQVVEDIGTEFNISAYTDEKEVKTTLVEGEAAVNGTTLKPNQQAILKGEVLQVRQVDPSEAVAWKNGYFQFDAENLESVMNKLARWYDVEVQFESRAAKQLKISGTMSRYDHISQVLNKIEAVSALQYSIRGRTVIIN